MALHPNVACPDCKTNKKMYYDKELSFVDRKNPEKNIPVYHCTGCDSLIQVRKSKVVNALTSMRITIFKNKDGKPIYHHSKISKK